MSVTARVKWTGGMQFVGESETGHAIVLDAAPDDGGADSGMRPMELLLIGVGSCSGMDIVSVLQKKRQKVTSLEVSVTGEKADTYPKRYTEINIEWIITGQDISEEAVKHAVDLSMEKYCSVKATLEHSAKVSFSYKIVNV
ncbi:MAG TPA: OsmC family protein [Dissulfurispiraceae bacterium]|nr:OsmC family protein [Dissulfurispiraceae bacterium]